jgi:hypothetical protein
MIAQINMQEGGAVALILLVAPQVLELTEVEMVEMNLLVMMEPPTLEEEEEAVEVMEPSMLVVKVVLVS